MRWRCGSPKAEWALARQAYPVVVAGPGRRDRQAPGADSPSGAALGCVAKDQAAAAWDQLIAPNCYVILRYGCALAVCARYIRIAFATRANHSGLGYFVSASVPCPTYTTSNTALMKHPLHRLLRVRRNERGRVLDAHGAVVAGRGELASTRGEGDAVEAPRGRADDEEAPGRG
jgi:hypothetical protein